VGGTAFDKAVDLIGRRAHFREELRQKLEQRGFEPDEVAAALERLAGLGYLDDRALALAEAERLRDRKGLGRAALAAELARKGAGREAIEAALEAFPADDVAAARVVAERWLRGRRADRAALARHLERKGWAGHVIFRVLNDLAPDSTGGTEPD